MPALADPQHEAFALHVAQGLSKRDAAVAAGYSEKSASTIGGRLAKKVEIAGRIDELQSKVEVATVEKAAVTVDRVLAEYSKLAFFDISKALGPDGRFLPMEEIDEETRALMAGLAPKDVYRNKRFALEGLAKHLGLFREQVDVTTRTEGPPPQIHVHFVTPGEKQ